MKYITKEYGLQFNGDWHIECINRDKSYYELTEGSILGRYGIRKQVIDGKEEYVASAIRCFTDLFLEGKYDYLIGISRDYIFDRTELFRVAMRFRDTSDWSKIDAFLEREFLMKWVRYRDERIPRIAKEKPYKIDHTAQEEHINIIKKFLAFLMAKSDNFVLKGGTALKLCYGLNRFSEDIDLDEKSTPHTKNPNIEPFIREFCTANHLEYNEENDTAFVQKYMLDYGQPGRKLKIEVSYRDVANLARSTWLKINGIQVYSLDDLVAMKNNAILSQIRIRDFYDMCFIVNNYYDRLSESSKGTIASLFIEKNYDYVDYLVNEQSNTIVDASDLRDEFLNAAEKIGLSTPQR